MKTKAKKTSSDSENILVAYSVFDRNELLHLQWTPTCGELMWGFVSYEVFACIPDVVWYQTICLRPAPVCFDTHARVLVGPINNGLCKLMSVFDCILNTGIIEQ